MTTFEDRALSLANRMLAQYGQQVVWTQPRDGAPVDPAQPWKPTSGGSSKTFKPRIAFLTAGSRTRQNLVSLAYGNSEVPSGLVFGIMAGNVGFIPALKDKIVRAGVTYGLEWLDTLNPRGIPLAYYLAFVP